jgi:site-specific recombinase XerD
MKKLKAGTTKNYTATEKYLRNFMQYYFKQPDVDLVQIDYEAILELESFIRAHPIKKHDPCLGNGVYKHMERVSKMFTIAKDMRWIRETPFDLYQSKKKKVMRENLQLQQFAKIENTTFQSYRVEFVKDLFIYDCYLGVSYIDLMSLAEKHFDIINGQLFCTIYRHKSIELCGIPVPDAAKAIMDKYRNAPEALARGSIFPYISNQEMNRNLKIITGILNLPIDLDTRIARRFFAKEVNLKNGVPIETVSKLLGHSKISTTKDNYADVDQEKIIDDTAKVQELFKQKKEKFMEALR